MTKRARILVGFVAVLLVLGLLISIPPIREKVFEKLSSIQERVAAVLFPPESVIFVPQGTVLPTITPRGPQATDTPTPTVTITPETPVPTATPTITPTSLPLTISLKGVRYMEQHGVWNYCGPTNLAMALSFWGWKGDRYDTGKWLMPINTDTKRDVYDKNVMPYEMVDYVNTQTELKALSRHGGTIEMVKQLLASGFPVLIEKGTYIVETTTGLLSWMGHYNIITGYDDAKQAFIVQDSYFKPDMSMDYVTIDREWNAFDNVFVVVYPPDKENDVLNILGDLADDTAANKIAAQRALDDTQTTQGMDLFFSWFDRGTALVRLQDYAGAATAYDKAFAIYPSLPEDKRPWRVMWYQTGPYFAYYYTGRYPDVIQLVNQTYKDMEVHKSKPYLEESFYWRALAEVAIGQSQAAIDDLKNALFVHPGFEPVVQELAALGVQP